MERYEFGSGLSLVLDAQGDQRERVKQMFRVIAEQEGWPEHEVRHLLEREGAYFIGLFLDEIGVDGGTVRACVGGVQVLPAWVRSLEPWPVESLCREQGIPLVIPSDVPSCEVSMIGIRQDFRRSAGAAASGHLNALRAIDLLAMGIYRGFAYPHGGALRLYSLLDEERMPAFRQHVRMDVEKLSKERFHYWCGGATRGCPDGCSPVWVCVTDAEKSVINWASAPEKRAFLEEVQRLCRE